MRQSVESQMQEVQTESVDIPGTELHVSRVALGTWAMGGWMWGGTDERESVATIRAALEQGINLIDRKSTRLNSSHLVISYAVFCLKKKKNDSGRYDGDKRDNLNGDC